jgi:hypothetical protein
MATNFGEASVFGAGNPQLPATIEAPPVGDPDGDPRTYETQTMADRLAVTQDDQQYQEITDQLTWVYNQIVPRIGVEGNNQIYWLNDDMYDVLDMEEAPEKYNRAPFRRLWNTGAMSYNPNHDMG